MRLDPAWKGSPAKATTNCSASAHCATCVEGAPCTGPTCSGEASRGRVCHLDSETQLMAVSPLWESWRTGSR